MGRYEQFGEGSVRAKEIGRVDDVFVLNRENFFDEALSEKDVLILFHEEGCEACGVDEYFDGVTLACTRCGVGQQVDWPEQLGCAPCPSGRYSPDHSACRPCAAGRAPDALSRGSCTPCGGETFSAAGHACEPCPSGTHSSSAHTECLDVHDISPLSPPPLRPRGL